MGCLFGSNTNRDNKIIKQVQFRHKFSTGDIIPFGSNTNWVLYIQTFFSCLHLLSFWDWLTTSHSNFSRYRTQLVLEPEWLVVSQSQNDNKCKQLKNVWIWPSAPNGGQARTDWGTPLSSPFYTTEGSGAKSLPWIRGWLAPLKPIWNPFRWSLIRLVKLWMSTC